MKPFEVRVQLLPTFQDCVELRVQTSNGVNFSCVYPNDMFRSAFNFIMEEVSNQIQDYVGNHPDEVV